MSSPSPSPPPPAAVAVAVAGAIPSAAAFAVHYPGYPSSATRAVETLGGLSAIAQARAAETNRLDLRFRPEDPYCHPVSGLIRPCTGLLLKVSKKPGAEVSASVVARVTSGYHFDGMADYQHVVPVHAAEAARKRRRVGVSEGDEELVPDAEDVLMMLPELFSYKNLPENLVLTPSVSLLSKSMQKGIVEHRWEMDIEPCLKIAFNIDRIPAKVNWEDKVEKHTEEWEWLMAVSKLFEKRPIWPRWSLNERLHDDGIQVTGYQLKRLLFLTGYYFSTGPFGQFWITKGYDPRKDPEARIYQKVDFRVPKQLRSIVNANSDANSKLKQTRKDLCHFRVFPNKIFVYLQLFELVDDFIQEEIRKPVVLSTFSPITGWFSEPMMKTLGTHVTIRFLTIFPKSGTEAASSGAEATLKSKRALFEKYKKSSARYQIHKFEKHRSANKRSNKSLLALSDEPNDSGHDVVEGPEGPAENEIDDDDDEEQEVDGYESPPLADEDDPFRLNVGSYNQAGESIPNDYLQELLRCFPFNTDGDDSQPKADVARADSSDSEYQIIEQESGDDDSS